MGKKAIAKYSNEDAPELSLPPFRSSYRFVNAMINQGNNMDMLKNMMAAMSTSMNQDNSEFSYVQPYSTNSDRSDSFMDKMKMMMMKMKMKDMMRSNYQNDDEQLFNEFFKSMGSTDRMDNYRKNDPMSQFKQMFNSYRSKRQATDSLDLGDRLVEKLADQKHQMEAEIGNMTCVLKEINTLDASNNLDLQAMKRDVQQYAMPSPWFGKKYEEIIQQTQLTEAEFFPLVMQLLHGEEMDYMVGSLWADALPSRLGLSSNAISTKIPVVPFS